MIFLDTSGVYALADKDDEMHSEAIKSFETILKSGEKIITHNYILIESAALLQRRLGLQVALTFLRESSDFIIRWITPELHAEAVKSLSDRNKSKLSLVDVVSFQVMKEDCVTDYIGFDEHFEKEGFHRVHS